MAETLGPMTELSAVNEMLLLIGEQPVTSLTGTLPPDATTAMLLLRAASRDLQEQGWQFNTDTEFTMSPTVPDGYLEVPTDALRIDSEGTINVAWREGKLYDLDDATFVFTAALDCTVVRHFAFANLPPVVRNYVKMLGMERLLMSFPMENETAYRNFQMDLVRAKAAFLEAEIENGDYNALTSSLHVSKILRRGI